MGAVTGIDWTGATWNYLPWHCTRVSPGCANCYALAHTDRYQGAGAFESRPPAALRMHRLLLPLTDPQFRQGRRIFMESMSDPFYGALPIKDQALVWAVMAADPGRIFQCLTKRHGIMRSQLARLTPRLVNEGLDRLEVLADKGHRLTEARRRILASIDIARTATLPLPNVMLGVSAENRHWWKIRVPVLTSIPAAARFVSAEPLIGDLGPVDLTGIDRVICGGESGRAGVWTWTGHATCATSIRPRASRSGSNRSAGTRPEPAATSSTAATGSSTTKGWRHDCGQGRSRSTPRRRRATCVSATRPSYAGPGRAGPAMVRARRP